MYRFNLIAGVGCIITASLLIGTVPVSAAENVTTGPLRVRGGVEISHEVFADPFAFQGDLVTTLRLVSDNSSLETRQKRCWFVNLDQSTGEWKRNSDGGVVPGSAKININARKGAKYCQWRTAPFALVTFDVWAHLVYDIPFSGANNTTDREAAANLHFTGSDSLPAECEIQDLGFDHLVYRGELTVPVLCEYQFTNEIATVSTVNQMGLGVRFPVEGLVASSAIVEVVSIEPVVSWTGWS